MAILSPIYAIKTQAPPTALILLSAVLLKYLALITTFCWGSLPLPRTLKYPALPTSITGTFSLSSLYFFLVSSVTRLQTLSKLIEGEKMVFLFKWKCLIPFFPKYPGWLSIFLAKNKKAILGLR